MSRKQNKWFEWAFMAMLQDCGIPYDVAISESYVDGTGQAIIAAYRGLLA